jgi:hypothetical protein
MRNLYAFLIFVCFTAVQAQTTFLVENFDYPAGAELGFYGWTAHSGAGQSPILVSNDGLSMSTNMYAGNGIGRAALVINNGSDENKPFSSWVQQPADGQPAVHTYASFLMKPNGAIPELTGTIRPYFFHLGEYGDPANPEPTSLSTAFRGRTFIYPGTVPGTFQLNLSFNENEANPDNRTGNYNSSQTHLLVVKYTSIAGADNDLVSLFVFKEGDNISTEPATPTIGPLTGTNRDVILQAVSLRQYQVDQNVIVDGIIVRDHWDMTSTVSSLKGNVFQSPFKMFPNPVQEGVLNISTEKLSDMRVRVQDVSGRVLIQQTITDSRLDVSALRKGVYFVQVIQDEQVFGQKIIVQ